MILRRAGLGLLVGAVLMAPSGASAGPALVFEPSTARCFTPKIRTPSGFRHPSQS